MIPIGAWQPDLPDFENPGALEAKNVIPDAAGYRPLPSLVAAGSVLGAMDARVQGAILARGQGGAIANFAGTAGKLYRWDNEGVAWTDVSRTAGGAYGAAADGGWSFAQFGDLVIAANGIDAPQKFAIGSDSKFAPLDGGPPVARFVSTVRDFVVMGRPSGLAQRVHWSGINNAETWASSQATQADFQDLPDGGYVMGIVGGEYGLVFQERAIKRMTYVGVPAIFQFDEIARGTGTPAEGSLARHENIAFFLSDDGFFALDGAQGLRAIGHHRVDRFFWNDVNQTYLNRISAAIDPINNAQWAIFGDGDGAFAIAYVSPTSFSVTGADVAAVYHAGRRVKATGPLTGTIYGTIASSIFATNTTVTVAWDSGSLQNEALTIAIGILSAANSAIPPAAAGAPGAVQLATQAETEAGASAVKAVTPAGLAPALMTWTGAHVFQSVDAGAGELVAIDLDRASPTPAANDLLMALRWKMRDAGGGIDYAAKLVAKLLDPTVGNEDAELQFATLVAGTLAARLILGQGLYTPNATGGDKGSDTVNAQGIYQNGVPHAASDVSIQSGTIHSPALADHGKTFIYTNAAGCTVTLPAASGLFAGWSIRVISASVGAVTFNRSSTDAIWSKNTSLTSMQLPSSGDGGSLTVDSTGGSAKFFFLGKRSSTAADFATTTAAATTNPHNLGVVPDVIVTRLVCVSNNLNYVGGTDIVDLWAASTSAGGGAVHLKDASNVTTITANSATSIPNKTTGTVTQITTGSWNFRVTAIVWN